LIKPEIVGYFFALSPLTIAKKKTAMEILILILAYTIMNLLVFKGVERHQLV